MAVNRSRALVVTRRTWTMMVTTTPPYVMNSQGIVTQDASSKDSMSCFMFAEHSLDALAKFWWGSFLPVIGLFVKHRRDISLRDFRAIKRLCLLI